MGGSESHPRRRESPAEPGAGGLAWAARRGPHEREVAPTASRGLQAETGRARTGSSETRREGDGELGEGVLGEGGGRREGGRWEGKGKAKGGPLRRRARGLPREGGGRAGAAAREGPRRLWGPAGAAPGEEGEGEPKGAERWAGVASPSPRSGSLSR